MLEPWPLDEKKDAGGRYYRFGIFRIQSLLIGNGRVKDDSKAPT